MEKVRTLLPLFLVSIIQEGFSVDSFTKKDYEIPANSKVRQILQPYVSGIENQGDSMARHYSNEFSRTNAEKRRKSGEITLEKEGLSALIFAPAQMVPSYEQITEKINLKKNYIRQMVKKRVDKGESLIGYSVAYIPENVWDNFLTGLANALTRASKRQAHLVIVFTFVIKTASPDTFIDAIKKTVFKTEGAVKVVCGNPTLQFVADLWSTRLSNSKSTTNIRSTGKEIWVTLFGECGDTQACIDHILKFMQTNMSKFTDEIPIGIGWTPLRRYTYQVEERKCEIVVEPSKIGQLVLVTKFPGSLSAVEEERLFDTFKKHFPSEKFLGEKCPLAKEVARLRRNRQDSIGAETVSHDEPCTPIIETTSFIRIVNFRFRDAQSNYGIPDAKSQIQCEFPVEQYLKLAEKIRGVGFAQLVERDITTNSINSCLIMVIVIDEEIPGKLWKLSDFILNPEAIESMYEFASKNVQPKFSCAIDRKHIRQMFSIKKEGEKYFLKDDDMKKVNGLKAYVAKFLQDTENVSVAVSILTFDEYFHSQPDGWKRVWITIILCSNCTNASSTYFKPK